MTASGHFVAPSIHHLSTIEISTIEQVSQHFALLYLQSLLHRDT